MLVSGNKTEREDSNEDKIVDLEPKEILDERIAAIGGFWHTQVRDYIIEDEMNNKELKNSIASETSAYGIISALFLTIAQVALIVEVPEDTDELLIHCYVNIWFLCYMANLLCLLCSTIEYIKTVISPQERILDVLAKRYPVGYGIMPGNCDWWQWVRYFAVDKFKAFRYGFWLMVPGVVCGIAMLYGYEYARVPIALACITICLAQLSWLHEFGHCCP